MRALVTGASGHLGSAIVHALLQRGDEVRALLRPGSDDRALALAERDSGKAERVAGDLLDPASLREALRGVDVLFQAASLYRYDAPRAEIQRTNVTGVRNALEAARDSGVRRIVLTSSSVTVGSGTPDAPADETRAFDLVGLGGDYVRTKREAERIALDLAREGLDVVVVNPAYVLGPGDLRCTPSLATVARFLRRELPGAPRMGISPVDVRDVARGHLLAAERGRPGERYLLGGQNLWMRELFGLIEAESGVRAPRLDVPAPLARLSAVGYEALAKLTGRPPLLTRAEASLSSRSFCFDSGRAERELGYAFRPARAVVADTVAWCRRVGFA